MSGIFQMSGSRARLLAAATGVFMAACSAPAAMSSMRLEVPDRTTGKETQKVIDECKLSVDELSITSNTDFNGGFVGGGEDRDIQQQLDAFVAGAKQHWDQSKRNPTMPQTKVARDDIVAWVYAISVEGSPEELREAEACVTRYWPQDGTD